MLALSLVLGIVVAIIGEQVHAQQAPDSRAGDLVRAGRVRVGLGLVPTFAITLRVRPS